MSTARIPSEIAQARGPRENLPEGPLRSVVVLAASPLAEDHASLRDLFRHSNWKVRSAWTFQEAVVTLRESGTGVVITESRLPEGHCWRELLDVTRELTPPPPLIVADQLADNRLWAEALSLGAYDVLMKPFVPAEVFRVVSLAWLSWEIKRGHTAPAARARAFAAG